MKPSTLFVNKADVRGDRHAALTWGAAQAGVAQGVLDAVADGTIPPEDVGELLLIAAVWVDWVADDEGGRVRRERRGDAVGARGLGRRPSGPRRAPRPPRRAPEPVLPALTVRITGDRLRRLRCPLDPPFSAAWDPEPRRAAEATLVFVDTDEGLTGIGSGDTMDGFERFRRALRRARSARTRAARERAETVAFHAGRYWPLEAAPWDLAGKAEGVPAARAERLEASPYTRPTELSLRPKRGPSPRSSSERPASAR